MSMTVIGLISGTSYDAVAAAARMWLADGTLSLAPLGVHSVPVPAPLRAQLVALAAAVAELRQAQRLAAQAQAVHAAAAHLHTAVNQSRPRAADFGHARSRGPTPAADAARLAGQDFPAGMGQPQPTAGSAGPARSRSRQQPRPGRRAGPAP